MSDDARFLIKLLVASAAIAALIKYVGPRLPLAATGPVALTIVLVPVAGLALWMLRQAQR